MKAQNLNETSIAEQYQKLRKTYRMDETECLDVLVAQAQAALTDDSLQRIKHDAHDLVVKVRNSRLQKSGLDAFLYEYDLSSAEGVALMCLAEALLRIPDAKTRDRLIKDKIVAKDWEKHLGKSHSWFVNAGTLGLMLTGKMLNTSESSSEQMMNAFKRLVNRVGEPIIRQAISQGMKILGKQFVMGETIEEALERAKSKEAQGYRYSYDMLGEAAKTNEDAQMYFNAYYEAIKKIGAESNGLGPILGPGVSVKLSALHPRYEWNNRERMLVELYPKLLELVRLAKKFDIGFTIDAEEADRLELSLLLIEELAKNKEIDSWKGFGLAVQAYQKRAMGVIDWLACLAKRYLQEPIMIRLVKGAYWDSEIKWTQEKGLKSYPVFTRKSSTDVSYIACVEKIFQYGNLFYPQFATHNAYSVAAVLELARLHGRQHTRQKDSTVAETADVAKNAKNTETADAEEAADLADVADFEFQCLHGMGDSLYDNIVGKQNLDIPCRIYAPVGGHEYLLAYLVRRLLENGANTSFVNRIIDEQLPIDELLQDPVEKTKKLKSKPHPHIPLPQNMYQPERPNSEGVDLTNELEIGPLIKEIKESIPDLLKKPANKITLEQLDAMISSTAKAASNTILKALMQGKQTATDSKPAVQWTHTDPDERAHCLEKMAEMLNHHRASLMALLIREGGKTVQDALSEVREAIDYCYYYAHRCRIDLKPLPLPGPTGEYNQLALQGRGVIACISPWNFPIAIFLGQIIGALAAGNTVIAKPASQTPRIAQFVVHLLHQVLQQAGFPKEIVNLAIGSGATIGQQLMNDPRIAGVMLTGSTETAASINLTLAGRPGPIVPLIAETGGQNAMIVDSSALPEQVVTDVITSAFNSAGQRCSALRVLFLQEEVAEKIINMLVGAMQELKFGDPLELDVDIGPAIDKNACEGLQQHVERMDKEAKLLYACDLQQNRSEGWKLPELPFGVFFAPRAYEIKNIEQIKHEVFGPILHVVRYASGDLEKILDSINKTGYGLTLGIHSRITDTTEYIYERLNVGNTYVNRNMIGAVVGVQPFGGQGLSGTGPKAGGPHMLQRLSVEKTLSINIAAAGGNMALMSLSEE